MSALKEIFSEDNGHLSYTRVMGGFVTATIILVWAQHCIRTVVWTPLDIGSVIALLGFAVQKVWQKGKEESSAEKEKKCD